MSWPSKPKRNGNDEVPADRVAVKIIRSSRSLESPRNLRPNSPSKQPVTKVARLVYETKRQPTAAIVKSIHSYRIPEDRDQKGENKTLHGEDLALVKRHSTNQPLARPEADANLLRQRFEINKEVNEIQNILNGFADELPKPLSCDSLKPEVSNIPHNSVDQIKNTEKVPPLATSRSKTDPFLPGRGRSTINPTTPSSNATTGRKQSARSKSSLNFISQRSDTVGISTPKQKTYDPEKARQYMEDQKERRKAMAEAAKLTNTKVDRDEIKKRLENLRKNTLAILHKNVKKARKSSVGSKPSLQNEDAHQEMQFRDRNLVPQRPFILDQPSSPSIAAIPATIKVQRQIKKQSSKRNIAKNPKHLRLSERNTGEEPTIQSKKIGLLRKPDAQLDKHFPQEDTPDNLIDKENSTQFTLPEGLYNKLESVRISAAENKKELEKQLPDLDLNVPDVKLKPKSRPSIAEKSTQAEPILQHKSSLPYWLQPTAVQLYPYNFIKAVRKKLEAITNPVLTTKDQQTETEVANTFGSALDKSQLHAHAGSLSHATAARRRLLSRPGLNEVSSINMEQGSGHKLSTASSVFTPFLNSPALTSKKAISPSVAESVQPPPMPPPPAQDHSKSLSEITSSVTVNVPPSNTISEVSSIHSEVMKQPLLSSTRVSRKTIRNRRRNDEDTTASSSVFSSPEKRVPIPMTSDTLHNTRASTNLDANLDKASNDVDLKNLSPLSVDKINNLTLQSKSSSCSKAEVKSREDFEKMLHDFNKSLSHVIEVNEKFQCALSKSPKSNYSKSKEDNLTSAISLPSNHSETKKSASRSNKYSSDFEGSSNAKSSSTEMSSGLGKVSPKILDVSKIDTSEPSVHSVKSGYITEEQKSPATSTLQKVSHSFEKPVENKSNSTECLPDSMEDASKTCGNIDVSPVKQQELQDSINFSKDSLDDQKELFAGDRSKTVWKEDIVRNQINVSRGDEYDAGRKYTQVFGNPQIAPNVVRITDDSGVNRPPLNSSMGSDIFAIFNQTELELSIISQSSRLSESHLNYSTLGLYEQLIRTEATKTDHLSAILKIREKSILDRTRGQIALLEIQKEKCKAKGLTVQISMIKRKQRAILIKMEKEREEIKRILKLSEKDLEHCKHNLPSFRTPKIPEISATLDMSFRRNTNRLGDTGNDTRAIVRGYELDVNSGQNLETLLQDREKELKRRREHVERLLQWHQRLDQEEEEVLRIEQMLYSYNHQKHLAKTTVNSGRMPENKKQKKLMEIDNSLRELQSIANNSGSESGSARNPSNNYVRTSGRKLNKLWHRLTGRKEVRFEQGKKYKLTKSDLEKLYEDAKSSVLADFQENENDPMGILSDPSKCDDSSTSAPGPPSNAPLKESPVPNLNLNFSSDGSEIDNLLGEKIVGVPYSKPHEKRDDENIISTAEVSVGKSASHADEHLKTSDSEYKRKYTSGQTDSTTEWVCVPDEGEDGTKTENLHTKSNDAQYEAPDTKRFKNCQIGPSDAENGEAMAVQKSIQYNTPLNVNFTSHEINSEKLPAPRISPASKGTLSSEIIESKQAMPNENGSVICLDHRIDTSNESLPMIENITAPNFETTSEETIAEDIAADEPARGLQVNAGNNDNDLTDMRSQLNRNEQDCDSRSPTKLEKQLVNLEQSLIELNNSFERVLSPDTHSLKSECSSTDVGSNEILEGNEKASAAPESSTTKMTVKDFLLNPEATSNLMPDIINEVELRRKQQILAESDIIQLENAVPHALLREIPNKPPPPYVPPAHGSPMTTIFPSEARIKDIAFRRTSELYGDIIEKDKSSTQLPSILDENITNIYERIILDICRECVRDFQPTFTASLVVVGSYKMPLALYNPPNRLKCIQEFVYKRVRKLLNMDKRPPRPNSIFSLGRRKRDHVDEILIQELYEEEHKWTNFDLEEEEVKETVVDEVFQELVKEIIDDFEESYRCKEINRCANRNLIACEDRTRSSENVNSSEQDVSGN